MISSGDKKRMKICLENNFKKIVVFLAIFQKILLQYITETAISGGR